MIMASRVYAHATINRNVQALQRPGALEDVGGNESNLFLIHVDAKMKPEAAAQLRSAVREDTHARTHARTQPTTLPRGWGCPLCV